MKKIVLSLVALLTSLSMLTCFVAHCADDEDWEEIIKDTIFSMLISATTGVDVEDMDTLHQGFDGLIFGSTRRQLNNVWTAPTKDSNGKLQFTIPNYDVVTGKYMLHYQLEDGSKDDVLVECTVLCTDTPAMLPAVPSVRVNVYGDIYYYSNALNYTITRTDGTVSRYVVTLPTGFNYSTFTVGGSMMSTGTLNGCTIYEYRGGENIKNSPVVRSNAYVQGIQFHTSTVNSVRVDLDDVVTLTSTLEPHPVGFYSNNTNIISPSSPLSYPHDIDIVTGSFVAKYRQTAYPDRFGGINVYCNRLFYCSFAYTNNSQKGNNLNRYWITPQTQNYYYNDYIQGGTTINETNVNNYFDGAFLPAFDIDPDLPLDDIIALLTDLSPDFQLAMRPTLDLATGALFDRLVDFFGNMPDINLDWDTPLDNDYWDIEFPPIPDSGGGSGGDITVNVDITRPLVPKVTTTYWLELDVGTQTTQTYPVALVSAAPQVFEKADEVVNTLEIMPLIGLLAVFGVAVAILFKGV